MWESPYADVPNALGRRAGFDVDTSRVPVQGVRAALALKGVGLETAA